MINSLLNRSKKRIEIDKIRDCDGSVATSPQIIADKFNNYFSNIASKSKEKIPPGGTFDTGQNMGPSIPNSIYLRPTNEMEIGEIIDDLKIKATSDTNIATMKRLKNVILVSTTLLPT